MKIQYLVSFLFLIIFISCDSDTKSSVNNNVDSLEKNLTSQLKIKISGSTTLASVFEPYIAEYSKTNTDVKYTIDANGSNEGFVDLISYNCDIAMSSNQVKPIVLDTFKKRNITIEEYKIAVDAIVFIVNYKNKVKQLTIQQISDIFTGKIANWKAVGGDDKPINVLSRDAKSGTYSFISSHILNENNIAQTTKYFQKNEEIIEAISVDENAISYTSLLHTDKVDKLKVKFDEGGFYISPNHETVINHKYRLQRGLYLYYIVENNQKIKFLIDKIHNGALQNFITAAGFIPYDSSIESDKNFN